MMLPAFSIIVPAYNCAPYLVACVDSILQSGITNDEIILINDGSDDDTRTVCDTLALSNPSVKVIHSKHQGVAEARNLGIQEANNDFILFVDGDDCWTSPFSLNELRNYISQQECDLWVYGYRIRKHLKELKPDLIVSCDSRLLYNWRTNLDFFLSIFQNGLMFPCWNKVFKKSIIASHEICFKTQQMEDFLFVLDYLEIISAVSFLQIEPYVYNKRYDGNSLTATIRPDITEGTLSCHQRLLSMAGPKMEGTIHRIMAPQYIAIINKCLSPDNKSSSGQILKNLQQSILVKKSLDAYNPVSLSDFISILMMRHAHYGLLSNYQSVVGSSKRILRK